MMNIAFPFRIDGSGRTATAETDAHIRQMIEQILFTSPGERVNRPTFGSGLQQLIFAPNSNEIAASTEFLVQSALQEWLGELIQVEAVNVENQESTLKISVQYLVRRNQRREIAQFTREI